MGQIKSFIRKIVCLPIKGYQLLIRPSMKRCCRYEPSCSQYALDAINQFGVIKGGYWALLRLLKCQPWTKGGYDPVLPNHKEKL